MPSMLHEGLIALVRDRPEFVADLLRNVLDVSVPPFQAARLAEAALHELVPVEYHADAVVLFMGDRPVFGVIVEAQLQADDRKFYTWPLYAVAARARHECPFVVVVVTPDLSTASWANRRVDLGGGVHYHAQVIGPAGIPVVTDADRAVREPQLAVLSVMAHGRGDPAQAVAIATAAAAAVLQLPEEQRLLYSALVESALGEAARKVFEMLPQTERFLSESQRRSFAEGKAEGKAEGNAEGEARSILQILMARAIPVTESQRLRIQDCRDLELLDRWVGLALKVMTADELFV